MHRVRCTTFRHAVLRKVFRESHTAFSSSAYFTCADVHETQSNDAFHLFFTHAHRKLKADFGLAREIEDVPLDATKCGTPLYMVGFWKCRKWLHRDIFNPVSFDLHAENQCNFMRHGNPLLKRQVYVTRYAPEVTLRLGKTGKGKGMEEIL